MDKPFDDPITIIENFMFEMAMYACYGEDEQRSFIFQNAVETAEELKSTICLTERRKSCINKV